MINLIVVVDPNYGDRIATAAQAAPVWAVDTLTNKTACERAWTAHRATDHQQRGAVTCYEAADSGDRLANLLNILRGLEEHHGEICDNHFAFPTGFVLRVFDLAPNETVTTALRELGFSSFVGMADGFDACK